MDRCIYQIHFWYSSVLLWCYYQDDVARFKKIFRNEIQGLFEDKITFFKHYQMVIWHIVWTLFCDEITGMITIYITFWLAGHLRYVTPALITTESYQSYQLQNVDITTLLILSVIHFTYCHHILTFCNTLFMKSKDSCYDQLYIIRDE